MQSIRADARFVADGICRYPREDDEHSLSPCPDHADTSPVRRPPGPSGVVQPDRPGARPGTGQGNLPLPIRQGGRPRADRAWPVADLVARSR